MSEEYGPWQPLPLDEAVSIFSAGRFRWWVTGGHALELHLGRSWRDHEDTDVSFVRADADRVRELLGGWQIHLAAAGVLSPWNGEVLLRDAHHNNLWCKRRPDGPWCLDLTVSDGDDDHWIYRRDPTLRLAWDRAVLRSADDVPYLSPELQLLYKSRAVRPKDDVDAIEVIPELDDQQADLLRRWLPATHQWHSYLR